MTPEDGFWIHLPSILWGHLFLRNEEGVRTPLFFCMEVSNT
jgi:hypothetical protein